MTDATRGNSRLMLYAHIYGDGSPVVTLNFVLFADVPSLYLEDHMGEHCHGPVEMLSACGLQLNRELSPTNQRVVSNRTKVLLNGY